MTRIRSILFLLSDIPGIGAGATRLARGIASDFFVEGFDEYYRSLKDFQN